MGKACSCSYDRVGMRDVMMIVRDNWFCCKMIAWFFGGPVLEGVDGAS